MSSIPNDPRLDRARGVVRDTGGLELLERLEHLDATYPAKRLDLDSPRAPDRGSAIGYDVVLVGGGLSLLIAPVLADLGLKVAVFERSHSGIGHREWNASGPELEPLIDSGLFSREEVDEMVIARYKESICRWHGGGTYPVRGVLDHAVDAELLLQETLRRAVARGVEIHDGHRLVGHAVGTEALRLRFQTKAGRVEITSRLMIDARGASSPYASGDLVCPTVGGVMRGLAEGEQPDEINPEVGEILVTTEHIDDGRQHLFEAFPGRAGETTVYLFYYGRPSDTSPGALTRLYARFFEKLPSYKRGDAQLVRPTFGYIPGWSRLQRRHQPVSPRIIPFGDASLRHSPLTFCGFGSMLRSFIPASRAVLALAEQRSGELPIRPLLPDEPIHAGTGALALLLALPPAKAAQEGEINQLLDASFKGLHRMGNESYSALMQDRMEPRDLVDFLRETAAIHPRVYKEVILSLGLKKLGRWGSSLVRELARSSGH